MSTIILDDELKAKLNGLTEHLEVRDPSGNLVGHFLPNELFMRMLYDQAHAELDRVEAEEAAKGIVRKWDGTSGKSTAEVLASLKKLAEQLKAEEQARAAS